MLPGSAALGFDNEGYAQRSLSASEVPTKCRSFRVSYPRLPQVRSATFCRCLCLCCFAGGSADPRNNPFQSCVFVYYQKQFVSGEEAPLRYLKGLGKLH